jgi:hypothetical protein
VEHVTTANVINQDQAEADVEGGEKGEGMGESGVLAIKNPEDLPSAEGVEGETTSPRRSIWSLSIFGGKGTGTNIHTHIHTYIHT